MAEYGIKSLSSLLVKYLEQVWSWSSCLPYSMLCFNSYHSPNLDGFSHYELTFCHNMTINPDLEVQPYIVVSGTFRTCYEKPKKNVQYHCSRLQRFRIRELTFLWKQEIPCLSNSSNFIYVSSKRDNCAYK